MFCLVVRHLDAGERWGMVLTDLKPGFPGFLMYALSLTQYNFVTGMDIEATCSFAVKCLFNITYDILMLNRTCISQMNLTDYGLHFLN